MDMLCSWLDAWFYNYQTRHRGNDNYGSPETPQSFPGCGTFTKESFAADCIVGLALTVAVVFTVQTLLLFAAKRCG